MNVFEILLELCSPTIRDAVKGFLHTLKKSAAKTDNPIDDAAVQVLFSILGFSYTEE